MSKAKKYEYQPRLEYGTENVTEDAWQEWGIFDTEEKAAEVVRTIKKDIKDGKYDNRLFKKDDEHFLNAVIEVIDEDFDVVEIIEVDEAA